MHSITSHHYAMLWDSVFTLGAVERAPVVLYSCQMSTGHYIFYINKLVFY